MAVAARNIAAAGITVCALLFPQTATVPLPASAQVATTAWVPFLEHNFPSTAAEVDIQSFRFTPKVITVTVGSTVLWLEKDGFAGETRGLHNVVSDTGAWTPVPCSDPADPCIPNGKYFTVTFSTPGRYGYFCEPHPGMKGTVVVQ